MPCFKPGDTPIAILRVMIYVVCAIGFSYPYVHFVIVCAKICAKGYNLLQPFLVVCLNFIGKDTFD